MSGPGSCCGGLRARRRGRGLWSRKQGGRRETMSTLLGGDAVRVVQVLKERFSWVCGRGPRTNTPERRRSVGLIFARYQCGAAEGREGAARGE